MRAEGRKENGNQQLSFISVWYFYAHHTRDEKVFFVAFSIIVVSERRSHVCCQSA